MTSLPAPVIPADASLRHMPAYLIDIDRLLNSEQVALGDPAANFYAIVLWCASIHQIPAGSLPDSDDMLAYIARLGRDVRTWRKMREKGALRGWVKHSDGRLYHKVVTEKVLDLLKKSRAGKKAVDEREAKKIDQAIDLKGSGSIDRLSKEGQSIINKKGKEKEEEGNIDSPPVLPSVGHPPGEPTPTADVDLLGEAPKAKPTTKAKTTTATRIPEDWEANEALRRFGLEQLGDAARLDREIDKFRDFWKAKAGPDARKMDWDATFKNWCRRAAEEKPRHGQRNSALPIVIDGKPKPPGQDYRADILGAASGTLESALTRRAVDPFRTPGR